MAKTYRPFRAVRPAVSLWVQPEPVAPPSSEVVAAVLALGDERTDCEDGRTSIRFSPARVADTEVALLLGEMAERALDVTVIWDEAEAEIVRVIDLAPLRAGETARGARNAYAEARLRRSPQLAA
jgi:hypothetical protein